MPSTKLLAQKLVVALTCCSMLLIFSVQAFALDTNLLTSQDAKRLSRNLNARQQDIASTLTDGNTDTGGLRANEPLIIVFEFPNVVSPEKLVVHLRTTAGKEVIGKIELLSSLVSPDTGYQLLRAVTLSASRRSNTLKFQPVGARWMMIRYTPAENPPHTAISEIEVMGRTGPPASAYKFKESPVAALKVLEELESAVAVDISSAEIALFTDAADGQLDDWSLAEAALLASGVVDDIHRAELVNQINKLEQAFRAQLSPGLAPFDIGQELLTWLHSNALHSGYVEKQTDLSILLHDNIYNCVSSAVLYSILGRRLELDVRGIEVPDHAFAILYDGSDYADVETTTAQGFNPSRNRKALEAFQSTTGFSYIPDRHPEKRREISALELVSFIYYNHGVGHSRDGNYPEALYAYFRALNLDQSSASAVKNALSAMTNWSLELSEEGDFEQALEIAQVGLSLAPEDRTLKHNYRILWQERIDDAAESMQIEEFTQLISQAHEALPDAGFESQQALYFIKRAETLTDQGQWKPAILVVSNALPLVNEASRKELGRYQRNLVLRWSNLEIEAQHWKSAIDILARGLELVPGDNRLSNNIAYVLQEWSESVFAESGEDAAEEIVNRIAQQFPEIKGVRKVGRSYAIRRIHELSEAQQYAEALELIDEYRHLLGNDRDFDTMVRGVFDARAQAYLDAANWDAALAIYAQARSAFPDNAQIKRNYVATWHQWANTFMDDGRWSEAAEVYEQGLDALPDERSFKKNIKFIAQEWLKTLNPLAEATPGIIAGMHRRFKDVVDISPTIGSFYMQSIASLQQSGEYTAAVEFARAGQSVIENEREALKVVRYAYDLWATSFTDEEDWLKAVEVYEMGLEVLPGDSRLTNNAVATWHAWAKSYMDKEDWKGAIRIYSRGLQHMPDTRLFQQNIRYCEQQMAT